MCVFRPDWNNKWIFQNVFFFLFFVQSAIKNRCEIVNQTGFCLLSGISFNVSSFVIQSIFKWIWTVFHQSNPWIYKNVEHTRNYSYQSNIAFNLILFKRLIHYSECSSMDVCMFVQCKLFDIDFCIPVFRKWMRLCVSELNVKLHETQNRKKKRIKSCVRVPIYIDVVWCGLQDVDLLASS